MNLNKSFEENVQKIFFRIIRNGLKNYQKATKQGYFDRLVFLESFDDEVNSEFWEKIINTSAFEMFIKSNTYLDISYTSIFNNIYQLNDDIELYKHFKC